MAPSNPIGVAGYSSWCKVRAELMKIFGQLSPPEREAVLAGTAARFYDMGTTSWTGR